MSDNLKNNAASEATANLYLNDKLADVRFVFEVKDKIQTIPANKAILAALSLVFDAMFFGSLKESKEVKIVDATVGAFKEFLQFFYLGEVTLSMENIETVARLADKYDVLQYVNDCTEYLQSKLKVDNMCWGLQLALIIKNQPLIEFCENEIKGSPKKVFASEAFLRCESATLEHLLRLPLTCSKMELFDACMEWAKNACKEDGLDQNQLQNIRAELGNSFKSIRFGEMTMQEFLKIHMSYKELFTSEEFQDIILQITSFGSESQMFDQAIGDYIWDDTQKFKSKRSIVSNAKKRVQCIEVVSFSSNQPLLLGEIWSSKTHIGEHLAFGMPVDVAINQLPDNMFHPNISPKNLYEGKEINSWNSGQLKIILPHPILIKPHTVYEIRIMKKASCEYIYYGTWNRSVKYKSGREIFFGYDNSRTGWIPELKFNKL